MIAFLPTTSAWCNIDLPHMTLVYAGAIDKLKPSDYNELAKAASSISLLTNPFSAEVSKVDVFGDTDQVYVLKFRLTPELQAIRNYVEQWNKSEYSFNPHATIGPATEPLGVTPDFVFFDRVMVAWGDDRMTFKL